MMQKQDLIDELGQFPDYPVTVNGERVLGVELGTGQGGAAVDLVIDDYPDDGEDWWTATERVPVDGLTVDEIAMIRHALGLDTPKGWRHLAGHRETYREHYVVTVKTKQHGIANHLRARDYLATDNVVHNNMLTYRVTDQGKALFGIKPKVEQPKEGENP